MAEKTRVLITGSGGKIGTVIRETLSDKYEFSGVDRVSVPGIDSLGGSFVSEQEVHVMATVLPHRMLGTFTQKQLASELGATAKSEKQATVATTAAPALTGAM